MSDETLRNSRSLDEIVFENRNKKYGAYNLRKTYRAILTKAFILGTAFFVLAVVTPFVVLKIKQMNAAEKQKVNANLIDIIPEEEVFEQPKEEEEPPPPPPPPKEEEKVEIIQNVVPEPKKAPKVETPPPPVSVIKESNIGAVAQEGVKAPPTYIPPAPPPSTGTKAATVEAPKPVVDEKKVYDDVEQMAEFPGGINSFRNSIVSNFDGSAMSGDEGQVKTEITFIVERDGSITDVKANGRNRDFNDEAIRTVKSIRKKWSPAKINGQTVRYRFRLPITMNFE